MKNVYDAVRSFYEQDPAWNDIIQANLIEGFLRKKAWQYYEDKHLQHVWQHILMFGLYLAYADIPICQSKIIDTTEMTNWLKRNVADFQPDKEALKNFYTNLAEFYDYLIERKIVEEPNVFSLTLEKSPQPKNRLCLAGEVEALATNAFITPDAPTPIYLKLDEHLQEILVLLNQFYQKSEYLADFERAIFLYHGIMGWDEEDLENRKQDFWLGFWDYFLFDYRLIKNDKVPIKNFKDEASFTAEFKSLVDEMVNARFCVFYVKTVHSEDWLECQDLLTGEDFFLPSPVENIAGITEQLFLGHLFSDNMVIINYIMSVPVSTKLRVRIKEQVEKLYQLFLVQEPNATKREFVERHAVAIRHTIDIFTTFSKLNITGDLEKPPQLDRVYPLQDTSVVEELAKILSENLFSFRDLQLCFRMWFDFLSQKKNFIPKRPNLWAAGIAAAFSEINSAFEVDHTYLADVFEVEVTALKEYQNKIKQTLSLEESDLRYLSEEGFIMLLLSQ